MDLIQRNFAETVVAALVLVCAGVFNAFPNFDANFNMGRGWPFKYASLDGAGMVLQYPELLIFNLLVIMAGAALAALCIHHLRQRPGGAIQFHLRTGFYVMLTAAGILALNLLTSQEEILVGSSTSVYGWPRSAIFTPNEYLSEGYVNGSAIAENVFIGFYLLLVCATASETRLRFLGSLLRVLSCNKKEVILGTGILVYGLILNLLSQHHLTQTTQGFPWNYAFSSSNGYWMRPAHLLLNATAWLLLAVLAGRCLHRIRTVRGSLRIHFTTVVAVVLTVGFLAALNATGRSFETSRQLGWPYMFMLMTTRVSPPQFYFINNVHLGINIFILLYAGLLTAVMSESLIAWRRRNSR